METIYLVDYENVHNEGIEQIKNFKEEVTLHIFYTEKTKSIDMDILFSENKIKVHKVPEGTESLDKHLVSYLGYLLAANKDKECTYIIVSKDKGFDKIIAFWNQEEGFSNISRINNIPKPKKQPAKKTSAAKKSASNAKINSGMSYDLSGEDRSELNTFMQRELLKKKYTGDNANRICKYVIAHCNDGKKMLNGIHNDLMKEYPDKYAEYYDDVKNILDLFVSSKADKTQKKGK